MERLRRRRAEAKREPEGDEEGGVEEQNICHAACFAQTLVPVSLVLVPNLAVPTRRHSAFPNFRSLRSSGAGDLVLVLPISAVYTAHSSARSFLATHRGPWLGGAPAFDLSSSLLSSPCDQPARTTAVSLSVCSLFQSESKDSVNIMDWKKVCNATASGSSVPITKKRLPKKIRQVPDYYFLPRRSLPSAFAFYGACCAAGVGAGMILEVWIKKKIKEDGGVIWEF
ncbi:uncharacterized protein LOC122044219 [Zingiber officinale]|uniref:uncharacterized protein LOC122044219 n=1 Tax=Zingiber officinale TaxID=94328 RepID=UPI001C4D917C|nr:uncharacterized protein LOC122044219 [Zingiber officinale]